MKLEPPVIRVSSLTEVLDGNTPVEFVCKLINFGYDRFYVKMPEDFRCDASILPGGQYSLPWRSTIAGADDQCQIRYLQLGLARMHDLMSQCSTNLSQYIAGGLESGVNSDGTPSSEFRYRKGFQGVLLPIDRAVADKVPAKLEVRSNRPMVVKVPGRWRISSCSYELHGITFKDIFVEEPALSKALEGMRAASAEPVAVDVGLPDDPYALKDSSPLVYEILRKAHQNRDTVRGQVDAVLLAAEFRKLNLKYNKNPKPFNDKRLRLAANLANPHYHYDSSGLRGVNSPDILRRVPGEEFFVQSFINKDLGRLLYAACCWVGAIEPRLGGDLEGLVDLLIELGFFDADDSDQVQSLVFFITGKKPKREFRHFRAERDR